METGWTRGTKYESHTCDWWDVHEIPRHYGTMGRPEVPVDILRQSWTTMRFLRIQYEGEGGEGQINISGN